MEILKNKHGPRYLSELVLFLYSFAYMLQHPTAYQYIYSRFSDDNGFEYHYQSSVTSQKCQYGTPNGTQIKAQKEVQSLAANFAIYYHTINIVPSSIMNLFYGALSDHVGRRCIMSVVLIGALVESLLLLANMYLKLPLWTIFIGNACAGLGGGLNGIFMLVIAYTADISDKAERSMRIGYIEASLFFGMTLSNFISGELIASYGFTVPQLIVVISQLSAIFYISFILKKSRDENKPISDQKQSMFSIFYRQPLIMWRTLAKQRVNRDLMFLAMFILVSGLTFIVSVHSVFTLYLLNRPFCWPAIDVGYIMGTYFLLLSFGTTIGMKVMAKYIPEWALSLLGYGLSSISFVLVAFASTKAHLYGAIAFRIFGGLPTAIFRGNVSKCVTENEQGAIFSVITSIEMLMIMIGIAIFNSSYARLNDLGYPGLFFLVPAVLIIFPSILTIVYWRRQHKREKSNSSLMQDQQGDTQFLLNCQNSDEVEAETEITENDNGHF